ncbi:MAG: serine hydroxymethyltransferase [Myxococcaceae bacterium]
MSALSKTDPIIAQLIKQESQRQQEGLELIASENYVSDAVLEAVGSVLTNKYAEGYPGARYYGGCEFHDEIEKLAIERAKTLFGAEHVNVQPHSGANANLAVYMAVVNPGDTILAMNLDHGGHLTHGAKANFSGRYYRIIPYGVRADTGLIDYDEVERLAVLEKPKMIIAGASAYARTIDFERFSQIAKLVGAKLFVDMAHIAGLVAVGLHPSPVPYADFVSTTTHKTLRGPRGGMILCKAEHQKLIDSRIFPGTQGGPLMHVIAGKAVCFQEALQPEFKAYQIQVLANAKALAQGLIGQGFDLVSGGTDNHLVLLDLRNKNISGKDAEIALNDAHMVVNKNKIPFDPMPAQITSGIRLGTPAVTTRGLKEFQMEQIARWIGEVLAAPQDAELRMRMRKQVQDLMKI